MTIELGSSPAAFARAAIEGGHGLPVAKEVLVLQVGDEAPSAQLLDAIVERGISPVVRGVNCERDFGEPDEVHAAILVGSHSADEAAAAGYLDAELEWIRRVDEAGATVLGVGHGARALATAFGGLLSPARRPIRGWAMVDTAIPHVVATGPWLTWQQDVIALPWGAQVLAHNRLGPQVFRLGRHLGVQFHPEATPRTVSDWANRAAVPIDTEGILGATARDVVAAASCTRRLLSTFINLI
jgi:GMP synthase (glutamine-hydrolysing)